MNDRLFVSLILTVLLSFWLSLTTILGQQEFRADMNASIQQPICVQLSGNYSAGVFFTNRTTMGVQYPITVMTVLNNATGNYNGTSFGTTYYVQACAGNTIDVKVAHCACENLLCRSGDCAVGTDRLYVAYAADGGVGWANGTTPTFSVHSPPDTTNYYFQAVDDYQPIAGNLTPNSYIYMRYWIDPRPNSAPSGVYNTTFKIRAVEVFSSFGTCSC
ncbi:MAG: hypothetical protein QXM68_01560 [Candidatus Aenigmatarchaeota archaeon]|nr:hypothetical protein [Candidatus Aenigmarchaeota archaeon]